MPQLDLSLELSCRHPSDLYRFNLLQAVDERQVLHRGRSNNDVASRRWNEQAHGYGNSTSVTPGHGTSSLSATIPLPAPAFITTADPLEAPSGSRKICTISPLSCCTPPV